MAFQFLAFLDFLAFFVARNFLAFLIVFPFFPKDSRGSAQRKNGGLKPWANQFADSRESPDSRESFQGSRTEPFFLRIALRGA